MAPHARRAGGGGDLGRHLADGRRGFRRRDRRDRRVVLLSFGVSLVVVFVGIPMLVLTSPGRPTVRPTGTGPSARPAAGSHRRPDLQAAARGGLVGALDGRAERQPVLGAPGVPLVGSLILAVSGDRRVRPVGCARAAGLRGPLRRIGERARPCAAAGRRRRGRLAGRARGAGVVARAGPRGAVDAGPVAPSEALEAARQAQTRADAAEGRAVRLTQTRTAAVDAADEERRRIERDLHDGAQQRLVALGVELGAAKRRASSDPEAAAALEYAHREVKETLAELRDLVRGIHPAVLTDRGLDAALSALAARSPVPVTVDVPGPLAAPARQRRPPGTSSSRRR